MKDRAYRVWIREGLQRAVRGPLSQNDICDATGIRPAGLSQFKAKLHMGAYRLEALAKFLIAHEYLDATQDPRNRTLTRPKARSAVMRESAHYNAHSPTALLNHRCPHCSEIVVGPDSRANFCMICAVSLLLECDFCGHGNNPTSLFCSQCGHSIGRASATD